ncbi:hypothetical protein RFI_12467, partial [Reticulomyxa filosa]
MSKQKRIEVGEMVLLTEQRFGIIRFKGSVKFSIGEWFGLELMNAVSRHDGMIDGTRYFRCSRNRGLFVRRSIIKEVIPTNTAQNMKKVFQKSNVRDNKTMGTHMPMIEEPPRMTMSTTPSTPTKIRSQSIEISDPPILPKAMPINRPRSHSVKLIQMNEDANTKIAINVNAN